MDGIDSLIRKKGIQILINRRCYCIGSLAEIARRPSTSALNNSRFFSNFGIASFPVCLCSREFDWSGGPGIFYRAQSTI